MRIFLLYFTHILGLFYFFGIPENIVKLLVLLLVIIVLVINLKKIYLYKFHIYLIIFIALIFQSLTTLEDVINYGFPFIIFLSSSLLFNLYKNYNVNDVKFHIKNLIYISLIGVFFKLILHGVDEGFLIGFLSMTAGQLGFLFPCLMLIFICELFKDNSTRIFFFIFLFLFGIINEKRSIVFFMPLIYLYYQGFSLKSFNLKRLALIFLLYSFAISLIPSLNIDNKIFGSVDIFYPFEYAVEYLTATYDGGLQGDQAEALVNTGSQYGRIALLQAITDLLDSFSISKILYGHGMGTFTLSQSAGTYFDDMMFRLLGFRGTLSSFLIIFLDSGALALLFFLTFLYKYLSLLFNKKNLNYALLLIIFYDIFLYSDAFLKILPISIYFFTLFPFVFHRKNPELNEH